MPSTRPTRASGDRQEADERDPAEGDAEQERQAAEDERHEAEHVEARGAGGCGRVAARGRGVGVRNLLDVRVRRLLGVRVRSLLRVRVHGLLRVRVRGRRIRGRRAGGIGGIGPVVDSGCCASDMSMILPRATRRHESRTRGVLPVRDGGSDRGSRERSARHPARRACTGLRVTRIGERERWASRMSREQFPRFQTDGRRRTPVPSCSEATVFRAGTRGPRRCGIAENDLAGRRWCRSSRCRPDAGGRRLRRRRRRSSLDRDTSVRAVIGRPRTPIRSRRGCRRSTRRADTADRAHPPLPPPPGNAKTPA